MFRHIFLVYFLFLFVCCQLCEQGRAAKELQPPNAADANTIPEFFKDDKLKDVLKTAGAEKDNGVTVNHIESAFLIAFKDLMVAFAEVNYTEKGENKINIVAKHIETNNENLIDGKIKEAEKNWEIKLSGQQFQKTTNTAVIKNLAVVVKNQKIYHITVSNNAFENSKPPAPAHSTPSDWHVRLIEGEVNGGGSAGKKTIKWTTPEITVMDKDGDKLKQLKAKPTNIVPSDGFAFVTSKNNIIFIMKGKAEGDTDKNITAVFQLKENSVNKFELLPVDITEGCYPTFFKWEGKTYKTPTDDSECSIKELMVFDEDTNTFNSSKEPISRLLNFLKDKRNFTNAVIGTKNVLLFTQQKSLTKQSNVNLWMYDGTRVGFVGAIVENIQGTFYGSLLHTDKGLFALHQTYTKNGEKEDKKFSFTFFKKQLKNVTDTLLAWKQSNDTVLDLCKNSEGPNITCTTPPPIDGLVGFLHKTINEKPNTIVWNDECFYTNVTAQNVKKEENGLKFSEAGAGAKWSIDKEKADQPYSFTDLGFTLLATVKIDKNDENSDNSLLGVALNKNKHFKLWCSKDKKWVVRDEKGETLKQSQNTCEQGKTYNVAFILIKDETLEIYVNGEKLKDLTDKNMEKVETIKYFYFGADSDEASGSSTKTYVTVTNVLLYNRPFSGTEVGNLKEYIKSVEVVTPLDGNTEEQPKNYTGSGSDEQTPPTLPASPTGEAKAPSPSRTEDGCVGGGVRVFSLLLAVLCVSAPLLHL